jgi:Tfp pilus assembly protein PilN
MINYQKKFHDVYRVTGKAGRAIGSFLSLSLADNWFSFMKVVCISLEADGIYLVYGEKALWRTAIKHDRYIPLEASKPPSPEYLASVVSSFVAEWKLFRASCVLCLPRAWTIMQNIELPLAAGENLSKVISVELDRFTPLSKENACYDYSVLGQDLQNMKILLAVARADQVQNYRKALQIKNIQVQTTTISSFAIKSLIQNTYPKADAIYLSVRGDVYEYGVIESSLLRRCASGNIKTGDKAAMSGMIQQLHGLCDELTRYGRRPQIIIDADEQKFQELRDQLGSLRISSLNRDIKLNVPKQKKEWSAASLGGALGALYADPHSINLLNHDHHIRPRTPLFLTTVLIVAIAAMIAYYFLIPFSYEQQKLDEMDRHIRMLKPAIKKVEALKGDVAALTADIQAIDDFKKQNDFTMDIIKDMTTILPPRTWLTRLKITDKTVDIEGYSASATEIILKLENSKYFQKVEFASPTFRDPRQNNDRFVIKMELKSNNNKQAPRAETKHDKKK